MNRLPITAIFLFTVFCIKAQSIKEANDLIGTYQFEKALEILSQLNDTTDIQIPLQRGFCYSRLGSFKKAITSYLSAVEMDSTNRTALVQLAQLYSRNMEIEKSENCYERLISIDSTNSYYFKQYASLVSGVKMDSLAIQLYLKALSLNPRDVESYAALGNLLLESEQYPLLDSIVGRAVDTDSTESVFLLLKGKSELAQHQYKNVIATGNIFLRWNQPQPALVRLLGIAYFQMDEYSKAIECMNYLLMSNVKSEWVYYYLGVSYRELGNIPKSIEMMTKAIDEGITENIGTYYSQLARAYEDNKDYKNAIHYYQAAYKKSKSKILLYHLARNYDIYFKDKSSAIAYYKRYLASDDTIRLAREFSKRRLDVLE